MALQMARSSTASSRRSPRSHLLTKDWVSPQPKPMASVWSSGSPEKNEASLSPQRGAGVYSNRLGTNGNPCSKCPHLGSQPEKRNRKKRSRCYDE